MTSKHQSAFAASLFDFLGQVWHAVKFGLIPAALIIGFFWFMSSGPTSGG